MPKECIEKVRAISLTDNVAAEFEAASDAYRFFVHPEAYDLFAALHDAKIPFVTPERSEFMGTPTSSYRSWLIRRVGDTSGIPFIVKMGVRERLLPKQLVLNSIQAQIRFDLMEKDELSRLLLFKETMGLSLKNIPGLEGDCGVIVRELPQELLAGECTIVSFSALMSVERTKQENRVPLIFEVIQMAIQRGWVKSTGEFIFTYLIQGYLQAIEALHFKHGLSFAPHGQNLLLVLEKNDIRFAFRDFERIGKGCSGGYIESHSFFYGYHDIAKLLNVLTREEAEFLPPYIEAPTQIGCAEKPLERNLNRYLFHIFQNDPEVSKMILRLSVSRREAELLRQLLDRQYLFLLSQYFDTDKAGVHLPFPSAESGSSGELTLQKWNQNLWKYRRLRPLPDHIAELALD